MSFCSPNLRLVARTHHVFVSQIRMYATSSERPIAAAKQKYVPTAGTYPLGFKAGTAHAGVKASNTEFDDLALIASDQPCTGAAVFTRNTFRAAPVKVSLAMLKNRKGDGVRSIIINSGCANAVTGKGGIEDAEAMAKETDQCFINDSNGEADDKGSRTFVMSTGVIGQRLPIQNIISKIPTAYYAMGASHEHWLAAAQAIRTTDTFPKLLSRTFTLPSSQEEYHFAGITKGAGMIHPNMATLLAVICTDVPIEPLVLSNTIKTACSKSFNCISVDGDMSTNDTLAILANGAAGGKPIDSKDSPDFEAFKSALESFAIDLAKLVIRDGEGATKFVTIRVTEAKDFKSARRIARAIACSPLVKTALYGKDANWGRVLSAAGALPTNEFDLDKVRISFVPSDGSGELVVLENSEPQPVNEERAKEILELEDIEIKVNVGKKAESEGGAECEFWTCDLSHEYVSINGDYRT